MRKRQAYLLRTHQSSFYDRVTHLFIFYLIDYYQLGSLYLTVTIFHSIWLSQSFTLFDCHNLSLYLTVTIFHSNWLSQSLTLFDCHNLSLFDCHNLSLYLTVTIFHSNWLSQSFTLFDCHNLSLYLTVNMDFFDCHNGFDIQTCITESLTKSKFQKCKWIANKTGKPILSRIHN